MRRDACGNTGTIWDELHGTLTDVPAGWHHRFTSLSRGSWHFPKCHIPRYSPYIPSTTVMPSNVRSVLELYTTLWATAENMHCSWHCLHRNEVHVGVKGDRPSASAISAGFYHWLWVRLSPAPANTNTILDGSSVGATWWRYIHK